MHFEGTGGRWCEYTLILGSKAQPRASTRASLGSAVVEMSLGLPYATISFLLRPCRVQTSVRGEQIPM
jgi:hypothetical protein